MVLASTGFGKSTFQEFSNIYASGNKFDLVVKWVKVNLGTSIKKHGSISLAFFDGGRFLQCLIYISVVAILVT